MAANVNKTADLAVAKSEGLAQILAVAIVTGAESIDTKGSPINKAIQDAVVLHAHELLTLHGLDPDKVLVGIGGEGGDNYAQYDSDNN